MVVVARLVVVGTPPTGEPGEPGEVVAGNPGVLARDGFEPPGTLVVTDPSAELLVVPSAPPATFDELAVDRIDGGPDRPQPAKDPASATPTATATHEASSTEPVLVAAVARWRILRVTFGHGSGAHPKAAPTETDPGRSDVVDEAAQLLDLADGIPTNGVDIHPVTPASLNAPSRSLM